MASRTLLVEIVGDSSSLEKAMGRASASGDAFGSTMKKVAIAAAAGLGAIGLAVDKSVKAALAAQASQARLADVFKAAGLSAAASAAQIDKAEKSGESLGFTSEQTSQALGGLITATGNVKTAMKDLSVAQDLARFKGTDLTTTTQMMAQAMAGSQRAIHTLGITIIPVTSNVQALKNAHDNLTNAAGLAALAHAKLMDKMATGQAVIAAVTAKVHGQAQAFAQTAAGSMQVFEAKLQQLEVTMGDALLPALSKVVSGLSSMVTWLQNSGSAQSAAAGLVTVLKTAFDELAAVLQTVAGFYEQHKTLVLAVGAAVASATVAIVAVSAATRAWAIAQAALNLVMAINPFVLVAAAIIALGAALVVVYERSQTFRNIVNNAFADVKAFVLPIITALENAWQHWGALVEKVATVAWDEVKTEFKVALAVVEGIVNVFADVFTGNWAKAWDDIKSTVSTVFSDVISYLKGVGKLLGPIALYLGEQIANGLYDGMVGIVNKVAGIVNDLVSLVAKGVNSIINSVNSLTKISLDTHVPGVGKLSFGGASIPNVGTGKVIPSITAGSPFHPRLPNYSLPSIGPNVSGGTTGSGGGTTATTGSLGGGSGTGSGAGGALSPAGGTSKKASAFKIPDALAAAIKKAQETFKNAVTKSNLDSLDSLYKQEEDLLKAHGEGSAAQSVANQIVAAGKTLQTKVANAALVAAKASIASIEKIAANPSAALAAAQAASAPATVILQDQENVLTAYQTEASLLRTKLDASTGKAKAAYQTALGKVQTAIQSTHDSIVSSLQTMASTAQTALQSVLSQVESAADVQLGNQFFQNGGQTPAEAQLAAMQQQDQAQQLQEALQQAQASGDQAAIASAQRAIDENNLAIQATAQRAAADKAYAAAQYNLNTQIEALSKSAGDGSTTMAALTKIAAQFGINLTTLADPGGNGLLSQLTASITDTIAAFQALTKAAGGKVSKAATNGAGNTSGSINSGNPFGSIPGLAAGGIVSRATLAMVGERGPEAIVPLSRAGGFGGGTQINVSFPNYVGSKQELIQVVQQGLIQLGRRNPRIFTGTGVTV